MKKKISAQSIPKVYLYEGGYGYCFIHCSGYYLACPAPCTSGSGNLICSDGNVYHCY
jgi:hypothetical protein